VSAQLREEPTLTALHFPVKSCGTTGRFPVASLHPAERQASPTNTAMAKARFMATYMREMQEDEAV
jgi:hypothetical protein